MTYSSDPLADYINQEPQDDYFEQHLTTCEITVGA